MAQQSFTFTPPTATTFSPPLQIQPRGLLGMKTIEIDNGSALSLSVYADGNLIRTVAPYVSRFCLNTSGEWQQIQVSGNNASIASTDTVTIVVYDDVLVPPLVPAFGVSAWGGGAVPNALQPVTPGSQLLAWNVQQLINLLTGVMTGQPVSLKNYLELLNLAGAPGGQVGPALRAWMQTTLGVIQAYDATLATLLPLIIEASSYTMTNGPILTEGVDAAGLVRSTGIAFIPSAGSGIELFFTGGIGFLSAYNRSGGGGPLPVELQATRFIAPTVGASGKQFLNRVVLPGPAPSTTFTPPGSFSPTLHTLTGLPASAVACTIEINMPGVGTDRLSVEPNPTSGAAGAALIDTAAGVTGQQVHCAVTSPSQLAFTWLSVATHPISVFLIDYDEPS
jgi:hypothetical protein